MAKNDEINYVAKMVEVLQVSVEEVERSLRLKPELPLIPFDEVAGDQAINFAALAHNTEFEGFTSLVLAKK